MKGWLMVAGEGWPSEAALKEWLAIGRDFALTLPEKWTDTPLVVMII